MIVEIQTDYDNSTNKRKRYRVTSDSYEKGNNLSLSKAKQLKRLLEISITTRQKLRSKFGVTSDR